MNQGNEFKAIKQQRIFRPKWEPRLRQFEFFLVKIYSNNARVYFLKLSWTGSAEGIKYLIKYLKNEKVYLFGNSNIVNGVRVCIKLLLHLK